MDGVEVLSIGTGWSLRINGREIRWLTGPVHPRDVVDILKDFVPSRSDDYDDGYRDGKDDALAMKGEE